MNVVATATEPTTKIGLLSMFVARSYIGKGCGAQLRHCTRTRFDFELLGE